MLRMTGDLGVMRVGYQHAIKFRSWSLTCDRDTLHTTTWSLKATVTEVHGYWSTQRQDDIALLMQESAWWRWKEIVSIEGKLVSGTTLHVVFRGDPDILYRI